MSQKANYFKLGLFVIGAMVAGILVLVIIGTGRFFERKVIIETYFKESVQGLDIGSKLKYRGVTIGEVTRISFTYVNYQLDLPITQRDRYVLVEAQLQPRLVGGRAAAGDMTNPENAQMEVEKGLRLRLAPQGITGTSYLEMDYIEPPPPVLPISWTPDNVYIPSAPSTVTAIVNAAQDIMEQLHRIDVEATVANINKLLDHDQRPYRRDRHQEAHASAPSGRWPSSTRRSTTCRRRSSPTRRPALLAELRASQRRAQEDAGQSGVAEDPRRHRRGAWRA